MIYEIAGVTIVADVRQRGLYSSWRACRMRMLDGRAQLVAYAKHVSMRVSMAEAKQGHRDAKRSWIRRRLAPGP